MKTFIFPKTSLKVGDAIICDSIKHTLIYHKTNSNDCEDCSLRDICTDSLEESTELIDSALLCGSQSNVHFIQSELSGLDDILINLSHENE